MHGDVKALVAFPEGSPPWSLRLALPRRCGLISSLNTRLSSSTGLLVRRPVLMPHPQLAHAAECGKNTRNVSGARVRPNTLPTTTRVDEAVTPPEAWLSSGWWRILRASGRQRDQQSKERQMAGNNPHGAPIMHRRGICDEQIGVAVVAYITFRRSLTCSTEVTNQVPTVDPSDYRNLIWSTKIETV